MFDEPALTRAEFLRAASAGALALGSGAALAGCGGSSASKTTASHLQPKHGGTLVCGFSGGGSSDTLDGLNPVTTVDYARVFSLYDSLVMYDRNAKVQLQLAQEITPNANATAWTIRLKPGITFHNGKDLTADDVIYTFQTILNPKSPAEGFSPISLIDVKGLKKLDKLTVHVPCTKPFSTLYETLVYNTYFILPVGWDPKHPVGTGPFKFESFTPGQISTFTAYPDYWAGRPYIDTLVIHDYADQTSQVNALIAGEVDLIDALTTSAVSGVEGGGAKISAAYDSGLMIPFVMNTSSGPFRDVRVRQAIRLCVDRPQMRSILFGGHGLLGNDLVSRWDPAYDTSLPQRHQDLEQAKSLLKQAGHPNLQLQLTTGNIILGAVQASEVLAQQARGAGVTIHLNQVTTTAFFGPNYLHYQFAQDYWNYAPYFVQVGYSLVPGASLNETHFDNPRYTSLFHEALATVDVAKRTEIAHEMQAIDYNTGGYIIPFFAPIINGYAKRLNGVVEGKSGWPFNQFDFRRMWLS